MRKPHERPEAKRSIHHRPEPAVAVAEVRAAEAFGEWLDRELEKLVARWEHLAVKRTHTFGEKLRG